MAEKYSMKEILEILNEPILYPLEEEDRFTIRNYLYPNQENLSDEDKKTLKEIARKYKDLIDKELEMM